MKDPEQLDRRSPRIAIQLLERWKAAVDETVLDYLEAYGTSLEELTTLASDLTVPLSDQDVLDHLALATGIATSFAEEGQQHVGEPGGKWMAWTALVALMYARIATRRGLPFEPVSAAGDDEVVAIYEALAREGAELERLPE